MVTIMHIKINNGNGSIRPTLGSYEINLLRDQIVFTIKEIIKACPHLTMTRDNWNGLGLIKAAHYSTASVSFHFLHFSVQEYMAAYYIYCFTA